jgi:leader peptidase (prepilin peptidase)/N-methyltransferase
MNARRIADWRPFLPCAGLLGLCVGSFLNVVIHRLPKMMERDWQAQCAELRGEEPLDRSNASLAKPRSRCPPADTRSPRWRTSRSLSWLLRGRAQSCGADLARYPARRGAHRVLSAFAAWHFGPPGRRRRAAAHLGLIALTFIDFDTQLLPDSSPCRCSGWACCSTLSAPTPTCSRRSSGRWPAISSLWSVYWLFKLATGKEGMGYGDFKLLAAIGAWLGWQMLPLTILLSSLVGAVVGIA